MTTPILTEEELNAERESLRHDLEDMLARWYSEGRHSGVMLLALIEVVSEFLLDHIDGRPDEGPFLCKVAAVPMRRARAHYRELTRGRDPRSS
jgi:hypothetical protein